MPNPDTSSSASPPPAPSATRRRHRRRHLLLLSPFSAARATSPSAASSSSASSPGLSLSFSFSRSPSPLHHRFFFLSPLHAASAVPFAWEHRPGVPKTPARQYNSRAANSGARSGAKAQAPQLPLPLPPSRLLSGSKVGNADGSFSISVFADDDRFVVPESTKKERWRGRARRRQSALAAATMTDCLAALSLCRQSCTLSRDCLAGTLPQRPRTMAAKAKAGRSGL